MTKALVQQTEVATTLTVLQKAVESGMDADSLSKILDMQERILDRQAAQEFADAVAEFQNECPLMQRTSTAKIATKSGAGYSYKFAALDEIAKTIQPVLHANGLSYSWDSTMDGTQMTVKCILKHRNGHREWAEFTCPIESTSGMSPQQKNASALTFAKRQSLTAVLGLTMTDPDTDGARTPDPTAKITADQLVQLEDVAEGLELGRRFYATLDMDGTSMRDIPQHLFAVAMNLLKAKQQARKK